MAFNGDMPLGVLSTVNFQDSGGNSIVGSFDSYTLAMIMKYGGYAPARQGDPRQSVVYSATTGTGSTGGLVQLRVPRPDRVRRAHRGGLPGQPDHPVSAYPVPDAHHDGPGVLHLADQRARHRRPCPWTCWATGRAATPRRTRRRRPPAPPSTGTAPRIQALNGASDFYAPQIGIGNPIRNFLWLNYATGAARSTTDFPSPLTVNYKGNLLFNMTKNQWQNQMSRWFGLTGATADTGPGLDTGVFAFPFNTDFDRARRALS